MNFLAKNKILAKLPNRLKQFVVDQEYQKYTAIDQAVWRYVMRVNLHFLSKIAHKSYVEGLVKTGVGVDTIPSIEQMNVILEKIGWAAVSVDGFIPPNAFMEFQAYNVLVIASDIRQLEHIAYTPAPDILHEAAGHAPIIANPEYAEYLRRFGEIGAKAISSAKDYELYEAIRHLSIIKEAKGTTEQEIEHATQEINKISVAMGEPSEMAKIRNLHWWTVEYGLIGTLDKPEIYGAGLLSSMGESISCLKDKVKKLPYSILAADQNFDITKQQPQLFVTPNFPHLSFVLEEFANTMAVRKGGLKGVEKLTSSKSLGTIELSTGLQISGVFTNVIDDDNYNPIYIQTKGETALAYRDKELIGHGIEYHSAGFGSPIGKLKSINLAIEDMSPKDLEAYGIFEGKEIELLFEGEISVKGEIITGVRNLQGKIILISFKNCTVKHKEKILFQPEWGVYDMAVGKSIVSAFSGPASYESFPVKMQVPGEKTQQYMATDAEKELENLYQQVRKYREGDKKIKIIDIFNIISNSYPNEWLILLEICEISANNISLYEKSYASLQSLIADAKIKKLIEKGLIIIKG